MAPRLASCGMVWHPLFARSAGVPVPNQEAGILVDTGAVDSVPATGGLERPRVDACRYTASHGYRAYVLRRYAWWNGSPIASLLSPSRTPDFPPRPIPIAGGEGHLRA